MRPSLSCVTVKTLRTFVSSSSGWVSRNLVLEVDQIDCTIASEAAATQFWSVLAVLVSPRPYFQLPLSTHLEMCIAPALARLLPGGVLRCQRNFAKVFT